MGKYTEVVQDVRKAFESGRTKSIEFRLAQLKNLLKLFDENTPALLEALKTDLHKSKYECVMLEISINVKELHVAIDNLREWCKPEKPPKSFVNLLDDVLIVNDPYGVVLVMGAWNYPLQVSILPMITAIAAGNCVILKPSELASATAKIIHELIPKYLDNDCYKVILADVEDTKDLLEEKFDYIFFTGSTRVGKLVHAAANKYLTPTTLELGGKSPVFIDESANIDVVAKRILWGKCINAGQTCLAPDYLLCNKDVGRKFINSAKNILAKWYGENPEKSPDYARIINDNHFQRIANLIDTEKVVCGGRVNPEEKYIEPTILDYVHPDDNIMKEEIFGPLLPILYVDTVEEAVKYINENEKPLAVYVFSENKKVIDYIVSRTSSGGVTINDTILHAGVDNAPFGGVGASGMGSYHGKFGFDTFVHKKTVLIKDLGALGERLGSTRYPPYTETNLKALNLLLNMRNPFSFKYTKNMLIFSIGVVFTLICNMASSIYKIPRRH